MAEYWTAIVPTFNISGGTITGLSLDERQTSVQSIPI